jgi:hypothetical protein
VSEWALLVHGGVTREFERLNDASALYLSTPSPDGAWENKGSGLSTPGGTPPLGYTRLGVWCKWSGLSTPGGTPPLGYTRLGVWCKWSGLSTAGGTPPLGYTRLGVWCKWSGLSTAGGTPPLGYPAGRVV